jgi:hypothetical protein
MSHRTFVSGVAAVLMSLTLSGCGGTGEGQNTSPTSGASPQMLVDVQQPAAKQSPSKVGDIAKEVAAGVGSVQQVEANGERGPLFIFEEFHTSKIGRLQTAVMLLRLREKYGLRKIGLEGGIYTGQRMDASWFHGMGGAEGAADREDLSVRWLAEGEISPPEFMAVAFKDVELYGVEVAGEYSKQPNSDKGKSLSEYLLAIAERSLSEEDKVKVVTLLQQGDKEKAFDLLLKADPWVKKQYESLKTQTDTSSEEEEARIRDIQKKASELGVEVSAESRAGLQKDLDFYVAAGQRSETMVNNMLALPGGGAGVPTAVLVGAAHTKRMAKALAANKVAFAVIRASDFNPKHGSLTNEQFERKSEGKWVRNSPGTLGKILNARNPPPVITRATGRSYASMNMAGMVLAHAARGGPGDGNFPDNVWPILAALPDLSIDRDSITRDGYDVTYRALLKQDDGKEKEAWGLVGTLSSKQALKTTEQRLLQAAADVGGGGVIPPNELPGGSTPAEGEGPRDASRKGVIISRTGRDTLAVFAAKRQDLTRVGKLSD